ncbi:MAG TPA: hypothetical protein VLE69_02590 [Candidatus Saccharimonadales bacterium]|nr:hypothetical protein [Candidatus Saccharimonadales bacterium]
MAERLPDESQALLLESVEARATREAEKLAALPLTFRRKLQGQRPPQVDLAVLLNMADNPLPFDKLEALSDRLPIQRPLFSRFIRHNRFPLDPRRFAAYVNAPRHKSKAMPIDPEEREAWKQAAERQPYHVEDKVQQSLFVDRDIARLRQAAISTVRYQLWTDAPLDEHAAIIAADAVRDFGYSLYEKENSPLLDDIGGQELALHIAAIGEAATDNPALLAENVPLLAMTEREQANREQFWDKRYRFAVRYSEDRLTQQHKDDGQWADAEVARLQALCEA